MITISQIDGTVINGLTVKADSDSMMKKTLNEDELYLLDFYVKRYKTFVKTSVVFPISKRYVIDFIGCETHKDVLILKNPFK